MTERSPKTTMVYTPLRHIPIGEVVDTEDGEYALRIKRPKSGEIEVISIGVLLSQVVKVAQKQEATE